MKTRTKLLLVLAVAAFVMVTYYLWIQLNSIPRPEHFDDALAQADAVEIFRFQGDKPTRWIRFTDPNDWKSLAGVVKFKEQYWHFSDPPTDSVVVQAIKDEKRIFLWEVRGDGHVHIRKLSRWYKMPIEPGFEELVRKILKEKGEDLPEEPNEQDGTGAEKTDSEKGQL